MSLVTSDCLLHSFIFFKSLDFSLLRPLKPFSILRTSFLSGSTLFVLHVFLLFAGRGSRYHVWHDTVEQLSSPLQYSSSSVIFPICIVWWWWYPSVLANGSARCRTTTCLEAVPRALRVSVSSIDMQSRVTLVESMFTQLMIGKM